MKIIGRNLLVILKRAFFLCLLFMIIISIESFNSSLFHAYFNQSKSIVLNVVLNRIQTSDKVVLCPSKNQIKSRVKFYKLSSDPSYHYEYRYELNTLSNESRLIVLLAGKNRKCTDWWHYSVGQEILSKMRSSGFSILAICTSRNSYDIMMPIQKNLDVYWIYNTLQMWMNDVYYEQFQHYPRLYLFGVSQGSRMCALLCRVLPIQAQILYIYPGDRLSLIIHSDHDTEMQNRLIVDPTFANWFYFDYCSKSNSTTNNQCPLHNLDKNYFNPVPPTYFIHAKNDRKSKLSNYTKIIAEIKNDAFHLGGKFLTHNDTIKLYVVQPSEITPDYMKDNFDKWSCKSLSSKLFYEHFINSSHIARLRSLRLCWCTEKDFLYFNHNPSSTKTWSQMKQEQYRDYVNDIKHFKLDFCEQVCGNILATHAILSRNLEDTLNWLNNMDQLRSQYQIEDLSNRTLR